MLHAYVAVRLHDAPGKPYDKQEMIGSENTIFGTYANPRNFIRFALESRNIHGTFNLYTRDVWFKTGGRPFQTVTV